LHVYANIAWFSMAVGVAVMALSPFVIRLMHLETIGDS